jgi:urease accessory protein
MLDFQRLASRNGKLRFWAIFGLTNLSLLAISQQAQAHHAMEGRLPANALEGLISGLVHPVIGFDHLAFVVAIGLLAATQRRGVWLAVAFVSAAMAGTGLHLLSWDLPVVEIVIALSVVISGLILAVNQTVTVGLLIVLTAFSGMFHGYAYGEAIIGAEATPLVAYLAGFTLIQSVIALGAMGLSNLISQHWVDRSTLIKRLLGSTIATVGMAFLAMSIAG